MRKRKKKKKKKKKKMREERRRRRAKNYLTLFFPLKNSSNQKQNPPLRDVSWKPGCQVSRSLKNQLGN